MLRLMSEKEGISVVADQWGAPTYAADLAQAILSIVQAKAWHPGIYHFSNSGVITWFDFAKEKLHRDEYCCLFGIPFSLSCESCFAEKCVYAFTVRTIAVPF